MLDCFYATRLRAAPLPAKAELKLSEFSRNGRWWKERKADDKIHSKMFILFSKTKEKTNAYGRREKLPHLLCDRKQWGLSKTWTSFLKTVHLTALLAWQRLPIIFVCIEVFDGV